MSWLGALSATVTVALTVLNAYWSNEVSRVEADIKRREVELEAAKERLSRYAFVQELLDDLLENNQRQRTLTVNLITLALTDREAEQLFAGFGLSDDQDIRDIGRVGLSTIKISELVQSMNAAVREDRIDAVQTLIEEYKDDPLAIDQALSALAPSRVASLSSSGRINVLVFLRNTDPSAWNQQQVVQARNSIRDLHERAAQRVAGIGPQTQDAIQKFQAHLDVIEASF